MKWRVASATSGEVGEPAPPAPTAPGGAPPPPPAGGAGLLLAPPRTTGLGSGPAATAEGPSRLHAPRRDAAEDAAEETAVVKPAAMRSPAAPKRDVDGAVPAAATEVRSDVITITEMAAVSPPRMGRPPARPEAGARPGEPPGKDAVADAVEGVAATAAPSAVVPRQVW